MSDDSYAYKRLDHGTDAIRLLRLFKGDQGPILCDLFETRLKQAQSIPYEALSYAWGTAPAGFSIAVNRHSVKVTNNLRAALGYLRRPHQDRILWIDAICIDQNHHAEKSHQVGQMRLIYKHAVNVLIWLGMEDESRGSITSLFTLMDRLDKGAIARSDYRRNSLPHLEKEWKILSTQFDLDHIARLQSALDELLHRPWFQRVWVIQEVASARSATIVCGDSMVSTRILVAMPYLLKLGSVDAHTQAVLDIMPGHLRQHSWWSKQPSIYTLLKKFGRCEASNEHDRLYALFGISSDLCENSVLRPDYEITLQRALQRMISYLLSGEIIEHPSVTLPEWGWNYFFKILDSLSSHVLMWAIGMGNEEIVSRILAREGIANDHQDINTGIGEFSGQTPLTLAALNGNYSITRLLLGHKDISVNSENLMGDTALSLAAAKGHASVVQLLLGHGDLDLNKRDGAGNSSLMLAVMHGHETVVHRLLLQDHIDASYTNVSHHARSGVTAFKPSRCMLKLIHARNSEDVNLQTRNRETPLTLAIKKHDKATLVLLFKNSHIDVNRQNSDGDSPLGLALAKRDTATVQQLLAHEEINLECKSPAGETALEFAVKRGYYEAVDLILQRWGILAVSAKQDEPVSFATSITESCKREVASKLLSNKILQLSWTAKKYEPILKLLVEYGMDHQSKDGYANGHRLLERAAKENMTNMIQVLLKNNVDVDAKDEFGDATAIWYAALKGHTASVDLLLKAGADIGVKSSSGYTPLEIAMRGGYPETAKALFDHIPISRKPG